jgi:hypothetical protein
MGQKTNPIEIDLVSSEMGPKLVWKNDYGDKLAGRL